MAHSIVTHAFHSKVSMATYCSSLKGHNVLKHKLVLGYGSPKKGFEKYLSKIDNFDWELSVY